jgi:hypothetical protein
VFGREAGEAEGVDGGGEGEGGRYDGVEGLFFFLHRSWVLGSPLCGKAAIRVIRRNGVVGITCTRRLEFGFDITIPHSYIYTFVRNQARDPVNSSVVSPSKTGRKLLRVDDRSSSK